jgi:glycosyltransferase involved in cell wall biosynthesis
MDDRAADDSQAPTEIMHFGIFGDQPGGMAQVVNGYLSWALPNVRIRATLTTRRARDPFAPFLSLRAVVALFRFRRRSPGGVSVFHLSERGSFLREGGLLVLASASGMATVAHLHGANFNDFAIVHPRIVSFVLRRAGAIGALTDQALDAVRPLVGTGANLRLVSNAVPTPDFVDWEHKEKTIVFGGEVGRRKGADLLFEAWRAIQPVPVGWTLKIIGPIAELDAEVPVLPNLMITGAIPHARLLEELDKATIAVLPSRDEALPMFLLEALARGCCVIATDVGQVASLLSADNGILVPAGDRNSLASAIEQCLLSERTDQIAMAKRGRRLSMDYYSEQAVQSQLVELWKSALPFLRESA